MSMHIFELFDNRYWGIYPENLDVAEGEYCRIAYKYDLSREEIASCEETAVEIANEDITQELYPFSCLTDIIVRAKMQALVYKICHKHKLDFDDFYIDTSGIAPAVIYKGERI